MGRQAARRHLDVAACEEGLTDAVRAEVVLRGLRAYRGRCRLPAENDLKRRRSSYMRRRRGMPGAAGEFQTRDSVRAYGRYVGCVTDDHPSAPPLLCRFAILRRNSIQPLKVKAGRRGAAYRIS